MSDTEYRGGRGDHTQRKHIPTSHGYCTEFKTRYAMCRRMELTWQEAPAFLADWKTPVQGRYMTANDSFHGGTRETLDKLLHEGTLKGLEDAEKLLHQIDTELDVYGMGSTFTSSVVGGSPRVGAYLSGAPNCMNRWQLQDSPRGCVRVYVNTALSGAVSEKACYARGVACVALAHALSKFRPVELWAYDNSHIHKRGGGKGYDVCQLVKLSTAPLDLSATCAALCTTTFARGFQHNAANKVGGAKNGGSYGGYETIAWSKTPAGELLELDTMDILTPPGYSGHDEMVTNPVKWVQAQMRDALKRSGSSFEDLYELSGEAAKYGDSRHSI
jgi:hypothetical protein